jgi:hypothetical protein
MEPEMSSHCLLKTYGARDVLTVGVAKTVHWTIFYSLLKTDGARDVLT